MTFGNGGGAQRGQVRGRLIAMIAAGAACVALAGGVCGDQATGPQPTGPQETGPRPSSADASAQPQRPADQRPRVRLEPTPDDPQQFVDTLLAAMTREEKIGQVCQVFPGEETAEAIRQGRVGSVFYTADDDATREFQRIAVEESRLGIPLIVARDVIHGFRTMFPIPIGQASSWNPDLVERAARVAADESRRVGVHWTFAPMVDIPRDARWGRIAESCGEDPLLASRLGAAMIRGFQYRGPDGAVQGVAACPKHFVAYGLAEGGRDYNRVMVSRNELRNTFLAPFKASVDAGAMTLMTAFNTVNGVPASGHRRLVRDVLKSEWGFDGIVVSDWASITEMIDHGYVADEREAAAAAFAAGVDMEMVSTSYDAHLSELIDQGRLSAATLDDAVRRVLTVKLKLGLFDAPYADASRAELLAAGHRQTAVQLARESMVLLKNDGALPLAAESLKTVAVIGPFAEAPRDQLGCWTLDGRAEDSVTPLAALRDALGDDVEVQHVPCKQGAYHGDETEVAAAVAAARTADVALVFLGEGWDLSGEARSRSSLNLPGKQRQLVAALAEVDTPLVLVVSAGRPLTIGPEVQQSDAVLYAWQGGTLAGPALADLLLGRISPSGRLPVTFPKTAGQVPLYYNHPNTGRPSPADYQPPMRNGQITSDGIGYHSHYVDSDPFPLFPFGFGLTYSDFEYGEPELSATQLAAGDILVVRVRLRNVGSREATEVAQLYVCDSVGSVVRPVKELKGFQRVTLAPGEETMVDFALPYAALGFYDEAEGFHVESGEFRLGVGGDSSIELPVSLVVQ